MQLVKPFKTIFPFELWIQTAGERAPVSCVLQSQEDQRSALYEWQAVLSEERQKQAANSLQSAVTAPVCPAAVPEQIGCQRK